MAAQMVWGGLEQRHLIGKEHAEEVFDGAVADVDKERVVPASKHTTHEPFA